MWRLANSLPSLNDIMDTSSTQPTPNKDSGTGSVRACQLPGRKVASDCSMN